MIKMVKIVDSQVFEENSESYARSKLAKTQQNKLDLDWN